MGFPDIMKSGKGSFRPSCTAARGRLFSHFSMEDHKAHLHPNRRDEAITQLKECGLKVTRPRITLLRFLIENHGPFTTEEVHERLKKQRCDLVTVYRCLAALEKHGIVRRCDFGVGPVRFEYQERGGGHHHHIICRECRKVENLDYCIVESIEKLIKQQGYSNIRHSLEFFGTCATCVTKTT